MADNPPQLSDPGDLTVEVGDPVTLHENAADPSDIASVQWQFSFDGGDYVDAAGLDTLTPQYTFPTYGDYDVLVTVTDNSGESSVDGFHVTATEVTPTSSGVTVSSPTSGGAW